MLYEYIILKEDRNFDGTGPAGEGPLTGRRGMLPMSTRRKAYLKRRLYDMYRKGRLSSRQYNLALRRLEA